MPSPIHTKLVNVMSALGWVEKRGENAAQNYRYVMADDIAAAVREKLGEAGVAVTASVTSTSNRVVEGGNGKKINIVGVVVDWTFTDVESGGAVKVTVPGEAMDAGDKALWKAMTGSLKYAMKLNFLLPTGEDPEEDGELDKEVYAKPAAGAAPARSATPVPARPTAGGQAGAKPAAPKPAGTAAATLKVPYGRHKGKSFDDPSLPDSDLEWLISKFEEAVAKNDEKWHEKNVQVLAVAQTEMAKRILASQEQAGDAPPDNGDIPF